MSLPKSSSSSETPFPPLSSGKHTASSIGGMRPDVRKLETFVASVGVSAAAGGGEGEAMMLPARIPWLGLERHRPLGCSLRCGLGGPGRSGACWDWQLLACWQMASSVAAQGQLHGFTH